MSRVRSVERAFAVLSSLSGGPQGVTQVALRTGLAKSTVARLLDTLQVEGAVDQDADTRYRLGPRLVALAGDASAGSDLVSVARPYLEELAAAVGEAAGLSVPDGFVVRYVDQVDTPHEVQVRDWTGTTAPMHAVSSGHVLLAVLTPEALAALLPEHLEALTARTTTDRRLLLRRLREVRRAGFAWVRDEFAEGISSVAAAIVDGTGQAVAAVHVHGPSYRFPPPGDEAAIADRVVLCATRISARIAQAVPSWPTSPVQASRVVTEGIAGTSP